MNVCRTPSRLERRLARAFDVCRRSRRLVRAPAFAAAFLLCVAPCASPGDWYVDVNAPNCATGTGGPNDPFCNIGNALAVAVDGDTIHVAAGTYLENLIVSEDVLLLGTSGAASTIVDGNKKGRVVDIAGNASVEIDGLSFQNGKARYGAGVLVAQGASLTLAHCIVQSNACDYVQYTDTHGGGISVEQATLIVDDCQILTNTAGLERSEEHTSELQS